MARVSYSDATRKKALQLIRDWDSEHGRGGTAQAMKKFKITFPTLKNWMAASELPSKKAVAPKAKAAAPKATARKASAPKAAKSSGASKDILARLDKILSCQSQIDSLRDQIEKERAAIRNLLG